MRFYRQVRPGLLFLARLAASAQVQALQRRAAANPGQRHEHAVRIQARILVPVGLGRAEGLLDETRGARWQHRALRLGLRDMKAAHESGHGVELLRANWNACACGT